jgi:hypothetical protein
VNPGELAILPAPDAEQVAHDIALLLAVQLRHVLVSTHLEGLRFVKKNFVGFGLLMKIFCRRFFEMHTDDEYEQLKLKQNECLKSKIFKIVKFKF